MRTLYIIFLIAFAVVPQAGHSQNNPATPPTLSVSVNEMATASKAVVTFSTIKKEDVLIVVTDSAGQTMFLENLHHHQGAYRRDIDLPKKGRYQLQVIHEGEKINRTIERK